MDQLGLAGGPYNGVVPFDIFKQQSTQDLLNAYLADPSLNWQNTIAVGLGVPNPAFSGSADLAGAMLYKIYADHGYSGYQAFYRALNGLPTALTADQAVDNFITAANRGTGEDYTFLFTNTPEPRTFGIVLGGLALIFGARRFARIIFQGSI